MFKHAATAYGLIGVITFGYSFNQHQCVSSAFSQCSEQKTVNALIASMAWPLYWSAEAWAA